MGEHPGTRTAGASVIGLDIGGANLKAAHSDNLAIVQPFPLWKQPEALAGAIKNLVEQLPPANLVAATMTGELCDCFSSKEEGVRHILVALRTALPNQSLFVWRNDACLRPFETVVDDLLPSAAANWLALACFAGWLAPQGPALLIDMGSTTTDIIPLLDGKPCPEGRTDLERLRSNELVYLGASRTPLCALLGPPYAAEWFATTRDVYLLLGMRDENPEDKESADARPATREAAHGRVARMLCADAKDLPSTVTREIAMLADRALRERVCAALEKVRERLPGPPQCLIISGSGEFLIEQLVAEVFRPLPRVESFRERFGSKLSTCACAFALAMLTQEYRADERPH
ncbi:MAG TPA: hydantoinase/oxoprolinase family protein [Gemmataceae bacterium]|nr:hydantoinase/oxoprolinase family protein [Gemmataceae bacterium]